MNDRQLDNRIMCCIPARLGSTRLHGKPLLKINGTTIIQLVYQQVAKVKYVGKIIVLTDSEQIKNEVNRFGGCCEIVTENCLNGTERIIKYLKNNRITDCNVILNVQGDEPFIDPINLEKIIENYLEKRNNNPNMVCSTLYYETNDRNEIFSRSRGKLVLDKNNNIMYCSRNIIPATKNSNYDENIFYKIHIGVFVYDYNYLINWYDQPSTDLQLSEDIEWLKILEQGFMINAIKTNHCERGVDTEEDYLHLIARYQK